VYVQLNTVLRLSNHFGYSNATMFCACIVLLRECQKVEVFSTTKNNFCVEIIQLATMKLTYVFLKRNPQF